MSAIVTTDTQGLGTHSNDLSASPGSTSVADNVAFTREGRPERRPGFKDYSTGLPDYLPEQLLASAAGDQAYLHLDGGIWYLSSGTWTRKSGGETRGSYGALGIWIDGSANYAYITGGTTHAIYKLSIASGAMSVLAGLPGTSGTANGTGTVARFNQPRGIWGDETNLYVCDFANFAIRKIVISTGVVTTFAGLIGTAAHTDNATGTSARFQSPHGIWSDFTYLYVTEKTDGYVRKIEIGNTQTVTTLTSGLTTPQGISLDAGGTTLYVTTNASATVKSIPISTGIATNLATGLPADDGGTYLMHSTSAVGDPLLVPSYNGATSTITSVATADGTKTTVYSAAGSSLANSGCWAFTGKTWVTSPSQLWVSYSNGVLAKLSQFNGTSGANSGSAFVNITGPS